MYVKQISIEFTQLRHLKPAAYFYGSVLNAYRSLLTYIVGNSKQQMRIHYTLFVILFI